MFPYICTARRKDTPSIPKARTSRAQARNWRIGNAQRIVDSQMHRKWTFALALWVAFGISAVSGVREAGGGWKRELGADKIGTSTHIAGIAIGKGVGTRRSGDIDGGGASSRIVSSGAAKNLGRKTGGSQRSGESFGRAVRARTFEKTGCKVEDKAEAKKPKKQQMQEAERCKPLAPDLSAKPPKTLKRAKTSTPDACKSAEANTASPSPPSPTPPAPAGSAALASAANPRLTGRPFSSIVPALCNETLACIAHLGFTEMAPVQEATIALLFSNKDAVVYYADVC